MLILIPSMSEHNRSRSILGRLIGRLRTNSRERGRSVATPTTAFSHVPPHGTAPTTPNPAVTSSSTARLGLICLTPNLGEAQRSPGVPDIIAIHGINGDPYKTWTHEGVFWLRDFLPEQIPGTRVFSFGYDAQVAFTTNRAKLDDYARSLLNNLKRCRSGKVSQLQFWPLSINISRSSTSLPPRL